MLRKNLLFTAVAVMGFAFAAGCGSPASSVRQTESGVVPQYESSAQTQDDASAADTAAADSTSVRMTRPAHRLRQPRKVQLRLRRHRRRHLHPEVQGSLKKMPRQQLLLMQGSVSQM